MSGMRPPPDDQIPEPPRDPAAATVTAILGVILLLPGVASILGSFLLFQRPSHWQSPLLVIWLLGLVIGAFGIALIVHASRRPVSDGSD
jgi:hypothetical protein